VIKIADDVPFELAAPDIVLTDDGLRGQMERATPLRRIGDPWEVAAAVVFLASRHPATSPERSSRWTAELNAPTSTSAFPTFR